MASTNPLITKARLRADVIAERHTKKHGTKCLARTITAIDGETAIVYIIKNKKTGMWEHLSTLRAYHLQRRMLG